MLIKKGKNIASMCTWQSCTWYLSFCYVHGTSCIVGMCAAGISTTTSSKVDVTNRKTNETGCFINGTKSISYININGIFTAVGVYTDGVINNRAVITVNSNDNPRR